VASIPVCVLGNPLGYRSLPELIAEAKAQIGKKAYLSARSTLNSVLQAAAPTSPQAVEAANLLKRINPLAAKQAQQEQQTEQLEKDLRNGARTTLEERLLSAGYDVQVGFVGKEGGGQPQSSDHG
jgi:hypothetical protein